MSAQSIVMVGNLAADPELTFTVTGSARCRLSVAVQDRFRDKTGQFVDGETYFARCVAWGDLGERIAASVRRGDRVVVQGAMVGRSWDKEDGTKGFAQEIRLDDCAASMRWAEVTVRKVTGSRGGAPDTVPDSWAVADKALSIPADRPLGDPQRVEASDTDFPNENLF
jgi:single-strand DNA-binding protein